MIRIVREISEVAKLGVVLLVFAIGLVAWLAWTRESPDERYEEALQEFLDSTNAESSDEVSEASGRAWLVTLGPDAELPVGWTYVSDGQHTLAGGCVGVVRDPGSLDPLLDVPDTGDRKLWLRC